MLHKSLFLSLAALVLTLVTSTKAHAWGAYHVGYTHYGPITGFQHYGATAYRGPYGGGYRYGSVGATEPTAATGTAGTTTALMAATAARIGTDTIVAGKRIGAVPSERLCGVARS